MQGIFISYRRDDSAGHAGRLFDRLVARFGRGAVFMDVEGIEAGVDFVETIEKAVGGCDVLLAVIGRSWLDSRDGEGRRRLDDDQDFIRLETSSALARSVRVIPVLVEGARMPRAGDLPEDLRPITRRQAVELRDSRWEDDIQALIGVLERVASPAKPAPEPRTAGSDDARDTWAWVWKGAAAALVLVGVLVGAMLIDRRDADAVREAALPQAAPAPTTAGAVPETPAAAGPPPNPVATASVSTPVPAQAPAPAKVTVGKPAGAAIPAAPSQAGFQPAPDPVPAPQPATRAPVVAAASIVEPVARRRIAVVALGEPTFRDFWDGEQRASLSAKVADVYRDALREVASGTVELRIERDLAHDMRSLEKTLREAPALCASTQAGAVFAARVEEPSVNSRSDSAYWPELRLTVIACDSGRQYSARDSLSPRRDDGFPFEKQMAETMQKFAREYRHLLQ